MEAELLPSICKKAAEPRLVPVFLDDFACDFLWAGRTASDRIAIAKPLRQITVFAACRAKWSVLLAARFLAYGAVALFHCLGFGIPEPVWLNRVWLNHSLTI